MTSVQMTRIDGDGDRVGERVVGLESCPARCVHPEKVDATRARLLSLDEAGRVSEVFKLLADPTRAGFSTRSWRRASCVCDLSETIEVPESSVSHALRLLRTAGIVRNRRDRRMIFPIGAIVIAGLAVKEAIEAWRGESCDDTCDE